MITMSISTMTGDGGQTSLWSGERVDKDSLRVEAYGTVDELNSFLGEAKHYTSEEVSQLILSVQRFLFRVGGQLASKDVQYIEPVSEEDVEKLTKGVHRFEEIVGLKGFVIPGSTVASAKLDICRKIARRAEIRIIALSRLEKVPDPVRKYINRLSDFLYILPRNEEIKENKHLYKNDID
jgi:ATP:cob(I)alamin adenosyltransferase